MSREQLSAEQMVVECSANRSHRYRVTFDPGYIAKEVRVQVDTAYMDAVGRRVTTWRRLWLKSSGKDMTITAACAIRSALRQEGQL